MRKPQISGLSERDNMDDFELANQPETPIKSKTAQSVMNELDALSNPEIATHSMRFFKTGTGEYGEGDTFVGVRVPMQRNIAKRYTCLVLSEIDTLLSSPVHEHRLTGLLILVQQYTKSKEKSVRHEIVNFYLSRLENINNWDLVDLSAPKILGQHLLHNFQERSMLPKMAQSSLLWERRVAVLATLPLIKQGQFDEIRALAVALLGDSHDLMHKSIGWMLRELGKVDVEVLESFLNKYAKTMPRTMLRYAIERLEPDRRQHYMKR